MPFISELLCRWSPASAARSATRENKEKLSKLKIFSSCIYNKYALKLNICQKFAERRIFDMIKDKHGNKPSASNL